MPIPLGILAVAGSGGVSLAAYFAAGSLSSGSSDTYLKFNFIDETNANLAGVTVNGGAQSGIGSLANSGVAGYFAGGTGINGTVDTIRKMPFATETPTNVSQLTGVRYHSYGCANSGTAGYWAGGANASGVSQSNATKLVFSNDANSTITSFFTTGTTGTAPFANSGTAGYWAGGSEAARISNVRRLSFSDDTRSNLATGLSAATEFASAFANSGTAGYVGGGDASGRTTTINKFAFPGQTRSTLGTGLSVARDFLAGAARVGTAGYFLGGNFSGGVSTTIDKYAFPSDTASTVAVMGAGRASFSGASNSGVL